MKRIVLLSLFALIVMGGFCGGAAFAGGTAFAGGPAFASGPALPGGGLSFQIKFSTPLAVFDFVDHLSANAPDNNVKKIYLASGFNQDKFNRLIAAYDSLNIDFGYEYTAYPYGQKIGGSSISLLKKELVNATDLSDFKTKALGIIPNTDLFALYAILTAFEPVYQQLIYLPNKAVFERQLSSVQRLADSANVAGYFKTGLTFYHSSWDESIPFQLVFYPLPGAKGFKATAMYNIGICSVPTGLTDFNKLLSVMIHEMFHIEYDEASLSQKQAIEKWVDDNPSKYSRYAYLLLNEALATALGNGYVYGQLQGKEDTASWYRRKYTNLMAKAIYPVVKSYIVQRRAIDQSFIDTYIQLYERNFSDWLSEPDNIFTDRYVLSDAPSDFSVIDQNFPYRSMSQYDNPVSLAGIDKMKAAPITKVVIVSKDNPQKLAWLQQTFAELRDWTPDARQDFTYAVWLSDKTYLLVINEVHKKTAEVIAALRAGVIHTGVIP